MIRSQCTPTIVSFNSVSVSARGNLNFSLVVSSSMSVFVGFSLVIQQLGPLGFVEVQNH